MRLRQKRFARKPLITGRDLIAAGYAPGPRFKEILTAVEDRQLEGTLRSKEEALCVCAPGISEIVIVTITESKLRLERLECGTARLSNIVTLMHFRSPYPYLALAICSANHSRRSVQLRSNSKPPIFRIDRTICGVNL